MVSFIDNFASDGGVSDIRFAVARRIGPRLALGLGLHAMTGSARVTAIRVFTDTARYATVRDTQVVRHTGFGVSASALLTPVAQARDHRIRPRGRQVQDQGGSERNRQH